MDKCEQMVVLFIIRQTNGYQKEWDRISFSQFHEATGMQSPSSVQKGVEAAIKRGIIERRGTKNSFEYRVCDPSENTTEIVVIDEQNECENTTEIVAKNTTENEVKNENTTKTVAKSLQKMKTQKKKENTNPMDDQNSTESQKWFGAVFWLIYGHEDYGLASKEDKKAIGKVVKEIRASPQSYTLEDLHVWYRDKWATEWPGRQPGKKEIQKPTLKQIKTGIGKVKPPTPPVGMNVSPNGDSPRKRMKEL